MFHEFTRVFSSLSLADYEFAYSGFDVSRFTENDSFLLFLFRAYDRREKIVFQLFNKINSDKKKIYNRLTAGEYSGKAIEKLELCSLLQIKHKFKLVLTFIIVFINKRPFYVEVESLSENG